MKPHVPLAGGGDNRGWAGDPIMRYVPPADRVSEVKKQLIAL